VRVVPPVSENWFLYGNSCVVSQEAPHAEVGSFSNELLFLHGRFETSELWTTLTDLFEHGVKSSFIDLPGFGRSFTMNGKPLSLDEHVEMCSNYIVSRDRQLILVGHDVGGIIGQLAALETERQAPHLIRGLILINSSSLNHLYCPKWRYFLARQLKKLLHSSGKPLAEHACKLSCPEILPMHSLSITWPTEERRTEIHRSMRHFEKPVLVLWGNRDEVNPPREVNELMANYPNVELFQDDSVGHWPWIEQPNWVSNKVQEFLFRIPVVNQKSFLG
jgi:pimeloyl-ACP methyl ester carboxylesterase